MRFRILLKRLELKTENVNETITACCILHNLFESRKETIPDSWRAELARLEAENYEAPNLFRATRRAVINMRLALARFFFENPLD